MKPGFPELQEKKMSPLPDFLIIGAAKSGTTSLYHYLGEHPEIFVSPKKEPRFFAVLSDFEKIVGEGPAQRRLWSDSVTTFEEYHALFEGVRHEKAIGEASPIYLWSKEAPKNIKKYLPEAKLIAILRHPVDRAFSHYLHNLKIGLEKNTSFEAALADDVQRHYTEYIPQGMYFTLLSRYYDLFPPDQIKVLIFDDLVADPGNLMQSIFQFLDVDDSFTGNFQRIHNASASSRSGIIKRLSRKILPEALCRRNIKPQISAHTANRLQNLYLEEISALQDLVGKNLTPWLKKYQKPLQN
jgi:hypothetical protein